MKINFNYVGWEYVGWINVAQNGEKRQAVVNTNKGSDFVEYRIFIN